MERCWGQWCDAALSLYPVLVVLLALQEGCHDEYELVPLWVPHPHPHAQAAPGHEVAHAAETFGRGGEGPQRRQLPLQHLQLLLFPTFFIKIFQLQVQVEGMDYGVVAVDTVEVAQGDGREGDRGAGGQLGRGHHWVALKLLHKGHHTADGEDQTSKEEGQPVEGPGPGGGLGRMREAGHSRVLAKKSMI